jgi:hypothetical protein
MSDISTALREYLSTDDSERLQADASLTDALDAGLEFPTHLLEIYSHHADGCYPLAAQCIVFLKLWLKLHPGQIQDFRATLLTPILELANWTVYHLPNSISSLADVLIRLYRPGTGADDVILRLATAYRRDSSWFPLCFELICDLTELGITTCRLLPEIFPIAFSGSFKDLRINFCELFVRATLRLPEGHTALEGLGEINVNIAVWVSESANLPLADFTRLWIALGDIRPEYAAPFLEVAIQMANGASVEMAAVLILFLSQMTYFHRDFELCRTLIGAAYHAAQEVDEFAWFLTVPQHRAVRVFTEQISDLYGETVRLMQEEGCRVEVKFELLACIASEFGSVLGGDLETVIGLALDSFRGPP